MNIHVNRFSFVIVVILVLIFSFGAASASTEEYHTVVENFLAYRNSTKTIAAAEILKANTLSPADPKVEIAYLAHLTGGGFIFVATSKELTPVKAYSLKADFDTLPPPYKGFLLKEAEYNVRTVNATVATRSTAAVSQARQRWDFLLNYEPGRSTQIYTPNEWLLTTQWNQDAPYDRYLPEVNGNRVLAGCVNIAMAQLMRYHAHPTTGQGVESYMWNGQQLKVVLYRPYNWNHMPDMADSTQPDYKIDEIARLIRDLAVVNHTSLGTDSSGASVRIRSLVENFGYAATVKTIDNFSGDVDTFFETMRNEIDAERPVLLSFPGHMTVADGYSDNPTGREIHVNFGWGGHDDGFYFLDTTVAAGSSTYEPVLDIYYDIKPCSGGDCMTALETGYSVDGNVGSARFDYDLDVDEHLMYLSGPTTLTGNRGYANQAFYISVFDSDNYLVASSSEPLNFDAGNPLSPDLYRVRSALQGESGTFYNYDNMVDYTVTITTNLLSEAEQAAVDATLDHAPVIYNDFDDLLLKTPSTEPHRILVDARDENGDPLILTVHQTHADAVSMVLEGNILALSPAPGATDVASKIIIRAEANGRVAEKSFITMVSDQELGFGKTYTVGGVFANQTESDRYRVVLDGACTLSGYNGFSNQAFFTTVRELNDTVVTGPSYTSGGVGNTAISQTFTAGTYFLDASLYASGVGQFTYDQGTNDSYWIDISCPDADDSTSTIAGLLGVDLGGTILKPGDVNRDGVVNLTDAVIVLKAISNIGLNIGDVSVDGDVNGDGKIGSADLIQILQVVSSLR